MVFFYTQRRFLSKQLFVHPLVVLDLLSCQRCPFWQLLSQVVRWSCLARWCSPTTPWWHWRVLRAGKLAVASSRCVFLSPSGDRLAHSGTPLATKLADGDVRTVLVMGGRRVFGHAGGNAFAAVKHDGTAVTWGSAPGASNSDAVKNQSQDGVDHVVGSWRAFAAV